MMQGSLAETLRVLRARRGLTLTEAAERAGVQRQTLALLERGERHPHMPTLTKIANGYDVPVEDLLEEPLLAERKEELDEEIAVLSERMSLPQSVQRKLGQDPQGMSPEARQTLGELGQLLRERDKLAAREKELVAQLERELATAS